MPNSLGHIIRIAIQATLFAVIVLINLNTVFNNAYCFGATVNDSTIFQSVIWRSGPELILAPSAYTGSFFNTHVSPINYLPNVISYFVRCSSVTYYAWVYALTYGILSIVAFNTFIHFYRRFPILLSTISTVLFMLSGAVTSIQWEPHQEIVCSIALMLFFLSLQRQRYKWAMAWLLLNATVREDAGIILASPLFFLIFFDVRQQLNRKSARWFQNLSKKTRMCLLFLILSLFLSGCSFAFQKTWYPRFNLINDLYYGANPIAHLTAHLIRERFQYSVVHREYLWLPCLLLIGSGFWYKDAKLSAGGLAFLPYWAALFFAKLQLAGLIDSYKTFPFLLIMVWPALAAIGSQRRLCSQKSYALLQMVILLAGIVGWDRSGLNILEPFGPHNCITRWTLQPECENAPPHYRAFGRIFHKHRDKFGKLRASCGVISLFPYDFDHWWRSEISIENVSEVKELDTLIWFDGDRDSGNVKEYFKRRHYPNLYSVINTKILIASQKDLLQYDALRDLLQQI